MCARFCTVCQLAAARPPAARPVTSAAAVRPYCLTCRLFQCRCGSVHGRAQRTQMPRSPIGRAVYYTDRSSHPSTSLPQTPDFFECVSKSESIQNAQLTESVEHSLWIEAQLNALHSSGTLQDVQQLGRQSKILEGVKAFVDVKFKKASTLRQLLRCLGAVVYLRFSKNITHLIFWNGQQEVLNKVHHSKSKIFILSPHWVFKCFVDKIWADETPYLLYGVTSLAIPMRLMAMGRIGTVKHKEIASEQSDSSLSQSQIVHAIETLSDELTSKLTSPVNDENVDVVEIISPIVDRVRKRLNEIRISESNSSSLKTSSSESCRACEIIRSEETLPTRSSDSNASNVPYIIGISKGHRQVTVRPKTRHTISRISVSNGEMSLWPLTTPSTRKSNPSSRVSGVIGTKSEPVKRRSQPPVTSEQLSKYTSIRFHKHLQRQCRSIKAKHALQLDTKRVVHLYRKMVDKDLVKTPIGHQRPSHKCRTLKARPVLVRTRSSVLNDLQNVPSSNEFVKKKKTMKKRKKIGNIVLSGISKIERETVFSIAQKLGVLKIASTVDECTRYVVSDDEGARTMNVMRALVKGIPVVTVEWAYRSLEVGGWMKGNDYIVPKWKTAHKAFVKGHMAKLFRSLGPFYISANCVPEAKHLLHLIRCCHGKTTQSVNRAAIFVAPKNEWKRFMLCRRNSDMPATFISEQSLLDSICDCNVGSLS